MRQTASFATIGWRDQSETSYFPSGASLQPLKRAGRIAPLKLRDLPSSNGGTA